LPPAIGTLGRSTLGDATYLEELCELRLVRIHVRQRLSHGLQSRCRCGGVSPVLQQLWWGEPSTGADVAGRARSRCRCGNGEAQSRCRCGRGEPSPGADVGNGRAQSRCRCGRGGPARDSAAPTGSSHACTARAHPSSPQRLHSQRQTKPNLEEPLAAAAVKQTQAQVTLGLTAATSAPGLGPPLPHLRRDWAHPATSAPGLGLIAATSAPGLGSLLPHLRRD
jgi:hypothetical protein